MTDFEEHVREYLKAYKDRFNYETMVAGHLDSSRFEDWVNLVSQYKGLEDQIVLSSGCGSAGDLMKFLEHGVKAAHGVEIDELLANLARARLVSTPFAQKAFIQVYNGGTLPYRDHEFDVVFSMHVIEHTKDPGLYLREAIRVLNQDGILFLDIPNRYYKMEQHTNLMYIHYLPQSLRDICISFLLKSLFCLLFSDDKKYRLGSLIGMNFFAPHQLIEELEIIKMDYQVKIEDAFFHSYDGSKLPFTSFLKNNYFLKASKKTTFRLVVRRINS